MYDIVTKQPFKAIGGWNDPANVAQLQSAVVALHKHVGQGQKDYEDACEDCVNDHQLQLLEGKKTIGCDRHLYQPLLFHVGNPFTESESIAAI